MNPSKAYRALDVKSVDLDRILHAHPAQPLHVGLDIGKRSVLVVLRWGPRDCERPWQVRNPDQLLLLAQLLRRCREGRTVVLALEPTGTYGDALRQACHDVGLTVHRVSPKMAHDYAEVFDGVPSQHDGKDAAVVAELAALGKATPWPWSPNASDQELAYWVDTITQHQQSAVRHYGRLEGLLARHWPEATRGLRLTSGVLLRCLATYGSAARLAQAPEARQQLRRWGGHWWDAAKTEELLRGAVATVGVRPGPFEVRCLQETAQAVLACRREIRRSQRRLRELAQDNAVLQRQAAAVGVVTACVLWVHLGDPSQYGCGAAYRKAMGLNLAERSSGQWQGRLRMSRRGSAAVRRWLYYAALRLVKREGIRTWYLAKKERDQGGAKRALLGVMRKLALALYQVGAGGATFVAARLFPGREVTPAAATKPLGAGTGEEVAMS